MSKQNGYALDLFTPVRHVATKLEGAAPAALSFDEIAAGYEHTIPSDLSRVQMHEKVKGDQAAVRWIIRKALEEIDAEEVEGGFRFPDGVRLSGLHYRGRVVHPLRPDPPVPLGDAFNSLVDGNLSDNVRAKKHFLKDKESWDELRRSMRLFGWLEHHPAVVDEHGVVIVGHRRLRVAEELNAEGHDPPIVPRIETLSYGRGVKGDVERFRLAIGSNMGAKRLLPDDWKKIGTSMRAEGWTWQAIADAFGMAETTVRENITTSADPRMVRSGRRRARTPEKDQIARQMTDQGYSRDEIMKTTGYGSSTVDRVRAEMRGERQAAVSTPPAEPQEAAPTPPKVMTGGEFVFGDWADDKPPAAPVTCECPNCGHHHQVQP